MPEQPTVVYAQRPSNSMGLAGFIISLVGWVSCGLLCPIGLVLSLLGLRKEPRGFAVAGVILGLLGSIWGIIAFFVIGLAGLVTCGGAMCAGFAPHVVTKVHLSATANDVEEFERANQRMPATLEEAARHGKHQTKDGWGRPLRLVIEEDGSFSIVSDGPDGRPDTSDDVSEQRTPGKKAL